MLSGSFVALVTPFVRGRLDEAALRKLIGLHLDSGTSGLVPCGSTGEASSLSPEEYRRVVQICVEEAGGKLPIVPGFGTNSTHKTLGMLDLLKGLKVDGLLVLVPYYNKPTQEGMFQHFAAVAGAARLPLIVYNIPGRTGVNLAPATLIRLAKACRNVAGTKEAAGSLDQVSEILAGAPHGFTVLSGDDSLTLPMLSVGAKGVISVAANILPREVARLCRSFQAGETEKAREIHLKLFPLIKALFIETNPIPVKAALGWLKLVRPEPRLPLTPINPKNAAVLKAALKPWKLLR